jgi:type I restriction enzyme, S subunit
MNDKLAVQSVWSVDRIKDHVRKIGSGVTPSGGAASYLDAGVPLLRSQNIHFDGLRLDDVAYIAEETHCEMSSSKLRAHDVLLNITGASIGRCTFVPDNFGEGNVNQHVCIIRPMARLDHKFLTYCLSAPWGQDQVFSSFTGASRQGLGQRDLGAIQIPLPPLPEQQRIAAYLDASCAALDAAVAAKRRQLETLDALRKSIIHAAFTDHSGAINERVKDVAAKITSGVTPDGGSAGYLDSGIPLLRSQNVHFEGLRLDDVAYISAETHAGMRGSQVKPRDVLLNITGASIGRCTFVPDGFGEGNVNQHVCVIRPGPCTDYRFLTAFLSSPMGQDQILSTFTGASRQGLSHSDLGLIRVPFPKINVQREIVAKIAHHDSKQRSLFGCIEAQIATLTAYRKSLIHECVTGQRRISEADSTGSPPADMARNQLSGNFGQLKPEPYD